MEISPIKTQADYEAALKEIEGLMSAGADSPERGSAGYACNAR